MSYYELSINVLIKSKILLRYIFHKVNWVFQQILI